MEKSLAEKALEGLNEKKDRTLVQYNSNSNVYRPTITTKGEMEAGIYEIKADMQGIFFAKKEIASDELLKFDDARNKAIMDEVADFRKMKDDFEKIGMNHKRGMLLYGRPGTGKSCLIKLMCQECVEEGDVVFISDSPNLMSQGLAKFKEVEPDRIAIVVTEEIDEVLRFGQRAMSELLDGQDQVKNVLFIGTTNHIDRIHPKFLREGRFDSKIEIGVPPKAGRIAFLKGKLGINEQDDIVEEIADDTVGFTFAQLREYLISVYCYKRDKEKVIARIRKGTGLDESLDYTDDKIAESVLYYYYYQDRTRQNSQASNINKARWDSISMADKILKEFPSEVTESSDIIKKVADIANGKNLVDLRKPLEAIFKKKDIDFVMSPIPHFRIKSGGKTLILVNKKYADDAEETVGDIAIGFEGKI